MITVNYYPVPVTGHLTITLDGLRKNSDGEPINLHLSFYPETKTQIDKIKNLFRLHSFQNDGNVVTKVVRIPSQESCGIGLSEAAIYAWFLEEFKDSDISYGLSNNNCASYVHYALLQGQLKSTILAGNPIVKSQWWPSTPDYIQDIANQIAEHIVHKLHRETEILINLLELLDQRNMNPLHKAFAMASEIKRIPDESDGILLRKPYCRAVKKVFKCVLKEADMHGDDEFCDALQRITQPLLNNFDYQAHVNQLKELASFLCSQTSKEGISINGIFCAAVKDKLMVDMCRMIEDLVTPKFKNKERIDKTLDHLKNRVVDAKNPHSDKFFTGTKKDLGWWVRVFGQPRQTRLSP